jgi:hypothetical protein
MGEEKKRKKEKKNGCWVYPAPLTTAPPAFSSHAAHPLMRRRSKRITPFLVLNPSSPPTFQPQ